MNTIQQKSRYFFGLLLLLISQFVFADSSKISDVAFGSDQVKNYTDVSISYLSQLLGTVGNVLHGVNGQILGQMFYVFNTGVLIAAGIWLCYTVLTVLLKSSQEGSFSGQNRNAAVIFLKIALGIAFLVPSPSTGYNVLQGIVGKIIVYGIDMADSVWNKTLDYMSDGGTIFSLNSLTDSKSSSGLNENNLTPDDVNKAIGAVTTILANSTCLYQGNSTRKLPANMIVDTKKHQLQFPGPDDDANATSLTNPGCGYVSWDIDGQCSIADDTTGKYSNDEKNKATKKCSYYQQGLYQVVTDLWQTGLDYANYYPVSEDNNDFSLHDLTPTDLANEAKTNIVNAFIDYINLVLPVTRMDKVTDDQKNFYQTTAREGGWATAGEFYWQLVTFNDAMKDANGQIVVPSSEGGASATVHGPNENVLVGNYKTANVAINKLPSNGSDSSCGDDNLTMAKSLVCELKLTGSDLTSALKKAQYNFTPQLIKNMGIGLASGGPTGAAIAAALTAPTKNVDTLLHDMVDTNQNPLVWARHVGQDMLKLASTYIYVLMGVFGILGVIGSLAIQYQPFGVGGATILSTITNYIVSLLKMMIVPLMFICVLGGVVLAFYLPLYPFFIFTFGIAGWLLSVLEAFIAAPLVALGLTHPEGHDFLGKAEQALILLLRQFVYPSLMIFGLIVGIILSYIMFEIVQHSILVIFSYIGIMKEGVKPGADGVDISTITMSIKMFTNLRPYGFLSSLILLIVLTFYTFLIYQLTVKAFSAIYVFPNRIWRWIGGFEQQDDSAMLAEQQKGIATQGGGQGAKMAADQVGQGAKGVTDKIEQAAKEKSKK